MLPLLKKIVARIDVEKQPSGTGFLITHNRIATAFHVLAGRKHVNLVFVDWPDGERERVATFDWRHPGGHDLAILTLDRPCPAGVNPLPWSHELPPGDARWSTFGFPSQVKNGHALVDEAIKDPEQQIHEWELTVLQLHTGAAAYDLGGLSGAPCVVDGVIVGVVTHQLCRVAEDGHGTEHYAPTLNTLYALPVALLADAGIEPPNTAAPAVQQEISSPLSNHLGPANFEDRRERRTRMLTAIRRRHDAPCFALKGIGRLRIPLRAVWREPSLRFTVGHRRSEESVAGAQPSTTEGRCNPKTFDPSSRSTLDAWIQRRGRAQVLTILGDMGSGKSVAMLHQEGRLLARAEQAEDAPLPLMVDARRVARHGFVGAVAKRLDLSEELVKRALDDQALRFVVLLDGADEVRSTVIEEVLDVLTARPTNIEAIVVTSRPMFRFTTFGGEEAELELWQATDLDDFLARCQPWARREVEAVRELQLRQPLPFLENPLVAGLCLLIAREEAPMLRNRSRVLGVLVERLFEEYARDRAEASDARLTWADVAPIVHELAYQSLQSGAALTLEQVHRPLRRLRPNLVRTIEGFLNSDLGIFVPTDVGYEFSLRGIAEFLAGQQILSQPGWLLNAADTTWGHEPVCHAIVWQHAVDPLRAEQLLGELLDGEQNEPIGLVHHHLRRILVALQIACDLGEEVPCAESLAVAAIRRLSDERSVWVGEKVADLVRGIAQIGGPVFKTVLAAIRESLGTDRIPRADFYRGIGGVDEPAFWIWMLLERDPAVRLVAITRLEGRTEPNAQGALVNMLFDEGQAGVDELVANRAGQALRLAARGPDFEGTLTWIRSILRFRVQIPSCAAAIALRPDEAPLEDLVLALKRGIGKKYAAITDIAAMEAGRSVLDQHWPDWQKHTDHPSSQPAPPVGAFPASSLAVKCRFARAIAPGLRFADADDISVLLRDDAVVHTLTHDFDILPTPVVAMLLERMSSRYMCPSAVAELSRRIEREPILGEALIDRGRTLLDTEGAQLHFPGRALEGLVRRGHEEASSVYLRWLPRSGYARGVHGSDDFPDDIIRRPEVRAALAPRIAWACTQLWRSGPAALVLARFSAAWRERGDVWELIDRLLRETKVPFEATHWYALGWALDCLRGPEVPIAIHTRLIELLSEIMVLHPTENQDDAFFWHHYMHRVLRFIADRGLATQLAEPLLALCGVERVPVCKKLQLHAICTAWPLLAPPVRVAMSIRIASGLNELTNLDEIPTAALRSAIDVASAAWTVACERFTEAEALRYLPLHPQTLMIVLGMLPSAARHGTLVRWLPIARQWSFPWVAYIDRQYELRRPIDEVWRLIFDAGLDLEVDS